MFATLQEVTMGVVISVRPKLRIFRSNVKSELYGSETWKAVKTKTSKVQTFVNRCLRKTLNIHWPELISNEELWRRTKETEMSIQVKRRKWNWTGYTLRKGNEAIEREILDWNPQWKRRRGRHKQMWRRSVHNETLKKKVPSTVQKFPAWPTF